MVVTVALAASGAAEQKTKSYKSSADSKTEPKSTVPPMKSASSSSSKDLAKVENEKVKGGRGTRSKSHVTVAKADKGNQSINFNGRGGGSSIGSTRNPGSLKGRLKQKGQGGRK